LTASCSELFVILLDWTDDAIEVSEACQVVSDEQRSPAHCWALVVSVSLLLEPPHPAASRRTRAPPRRVPPVPNG
jgi:hypothetical protein